MRRSRMLAAAAIAVAVVIVGAGAVWFLRGGDDPEDTARRFLAAWSGGDAAAMKALTDRPPADFEQRLARMRDDLGVTRQRYTVARSAGPKDGQAGGAYSAELTLAGDRAWRFEGRSRSSSATATGSSGGRRRSCTRTSGKGSGSARPAPGRTAPPSSPPTAAT